jgi:hypothetical protein
VNPLHFILVVLLVLLLVGAFGGYSGWHSYGWHAPGGLGLVLIFILLFILFR